MKVEGEQVKGEGVVYYQIIVPMDRGGSATQAMNRESAIFEQLQLRLSCFDVGFGPGNPGLIAVANAQRYGYTE